MTTTFARWLRQQRQRQDAVGDLARDQAADECWPRRGPSLAALEEHHATPEALEALRRAWAEWSEEAMP